ncbi:MAG: 5'/3'-nucleotidase SurE [Lachnospiraceae bacterium]|nr:5'/3'-nucleotidase SurE [Lachnospiraceae bacterium]MBP3611019.1 5'/3'-nucleotidase SurE [Lachnospiraceae bacterium]
MRILITNDDSISSPVLLPLAQWAKQFGEVTVVVPKYEQSGKSHSIEIHKAFEVVKVDLGDPEIPAYTVDSSPADCIRYAMEGLRLKPDFILSGINRGLNLGIDMLYSGTVGAVFEAACFGIPAVALSTTPDSLDDALNALDGIRDFFVKHDLMKKNSIYNVNIPPDNKGIRITRMGGRYYADNFLPQENNLFLPQGYSVWENNGDDTIDTNAALTGYISILPLTLDRTNMEVFSALKNLNES